jgi:hypothetical protein
VATLFHNKGNALLLAKMYWATFWAIFSQTHLVTLFVYAVHSVVKITFREKPAIHQSLLKDLLAFDIFDI